MNMLQVKIRNLEKFNQWQQIIDLLEPLVENGLMEVYVFRSLGFAYTQLDKYHKARFCYKQWIELEPDKAQPYYHIGFTFYDQAHWNEAIEWFDQALERFPRYLVCLYRKGVALFMAGKILKSIEVLQQAIVVYQDDGDALLKLRLKKYYYRSVFYLGKNYYLIKEYEKARFCFEKIEAEDHRNYIEPVFVKYNLALTLMQIKEYAQAERIATQLTKIKPKAEWLFDFLGRLYIQQARYEKAIEQIDRAIKIRIQPYILIDRAKAYYLNGQKEQAKRDLDEALRRDRKGKHKILLELSKIAFEEKQFSKALVYAKRSIEFKLKIYEADYAEAHLLLSEIYKATGDKQNAENELAKAMELKPQLEWDDETLLRSKTIL